MATDWRKETVIDLQRDGVLLVEDGNHGESRPREDEFVDDGVAFIRAADMDEGTVLFDAASKINEKARQRITKGIGAPGDVLLSHKGTVGKLAFVPDDAPPFVCSPQTTFWRSLNQNIINREYLFAFLRSNDFRDQLAARAGETDMAPYVSLTAQRSFFVKLPPIDVQRAIAHIIGTLDEKIRLNRKMNETLEAMARALFKSWFVDFDPVHAKAAGRDTGLPKEIANLFPSEFHPSNFGKIPKGWFCSSIGKELETLLGGTPSRSVSKYWGGSIPWINSGKANEFRVVEPSEFITKEGLEESATKLLPKRTTIIAITGATLGQVSLIEIETTANQSIVGVLGSGKIPSEYVYFWVKENLKKLLTRTTGAAQQHINKNDVNELLVVFPDEKLMKIYLEVVHPVFNRIYENCIETLRLSEVRDRLLPRLISGELHVPTASAK